MSNRHAEQIVATIKELYSHTALLERAMPDWDAKTAQRGLKTLDNLRKRIIELESLTYRRG